MSFYQRRLPHWYPENKDLFLTFRLHGSLPPHRYIPPSGLTAGQTFAWMDGYLDRAAFGPTWLERPEIAKLIVDALYYGQDTLRRYDLLAFVVMANHVHLLISPLAPPP